MAIQGQTLDELKSQIKDYALPNRFEIVLLPPSAVADATELKISNFLIKSVNAPEIGVGSIPIQHLGKRVMVPGDSVYGELSVVLRVDDDYKIVRALEKWIYSVFGPRIDDMGSVGTYADTFDSGNMILYAYDRKMNLKWARKYIGIFPTNMGAFNFDMEATDQPLEMTINFAYTALEKTTR